MSETILDNEVNQNLTQVKNKPTKFREDSPCPACGQLCPNDAYCINCGYVYSPLLKKYLKREQPSGKKAKQNQNTFMANRNPDGSYNDLPSTKLTKKQALMVKIGKEFKRQYGKAAKVGDIVRQQNQDGSYNQSSFWHIYTPKGWVRSPSKKRKPTESQIKRLCKTPKKGR